MGMEDTGDPPATEAQLQSFWISAGNLGWDKVAVHGLTEELWGVSSTKDFSNRRLTELKTRMAERNKQRRSAS